MARWDEQLKGLTELESRCLTLREEVLLSERQEVLTDLMVSKKDMQKTTSEDFQMQVFEELEEQRAKEVLALVQKKDKLIKWEGERERARTMQRLEAPRAKRSMVRRPRLFFFWFLLIVPGLQHRRSSVCFFQDRTRGG